MSNAPARPEPAAAGPCPRCGCYTVVADPAGDALPAERVNVCGQCGQSRHPIQPHTPAYIEQVRRN